MISEKMYRALLLVYPGKHRQEYGEPMVQLFRDIMRHKGGGIRTLAMWVHVVFDLVRSAFREHKEGIMWEGLRARRAIVRTGEFLLRTSVTACVIHVTLSGAIFAAVLVSAVAGWYPWYVEGGPLESLGYSMQIENRVTFSVGWQFSLTAALIFLVGAGLLNGAWSAIRTARTSFR